ncbi:PadR family transcriptional regulator [Sedimentibacter sp. MB31-C6]|uniref:PadR family transcriptional regulator n=1 Tax=Sedimentibacter sp. MB31-C6 TaxID=3109366 RepID=UPI002DDD1931|nr:PadR family transcriptional regulator [Sedimentibacter sp. MB36-C1]WSI04567.1 PadR family transcriptional regulator [Sedimentibacter sp. MB36-C1]
MKDNIQGGALTETTLLILLALFNPNHGYGIMQFIEEKTNGRVRLGPGTLYGAINTLYKKSWIIPYNEDDSRKKQYIITELGKKQVVSENRRLAEILNLVEMALGGEGDDESI